MQSSLREDYLEAIQVFHETNGRAPAAREIAGILRRDPAGVKTELGELAAAGDLSVGAGGAITLTARGAGTAFPRVRRSAPTVRR